MGKLKIAGLALLGFLFVNGLVVMNSARAGPKLNPDELKQQIEQTYPVCVLGIRAIKADVKTAYTVTVMIRGGDSNDAFQVTTLAVDAATGMLVPAFRHGPSGPARIGRAFETQFERRPSILRSGDVWR